MKLNKVFLGGTCNGSEWRNELIPMLKIDYFNPVVENWTPECQAEEEYQKKVCKWQLYVITPQMTGVFSIAEAVQGSNKDPKHTIFCVLKEHQGKVFENFNIKSLNATSKLISENGAIICESLNEVADILNKNI